MVKALQRRYMVMVFPVIVLFGVLALLRSLEIVPEGSCTLPPFWSPALFTLAATTGIAGPIFLRAVFAHTSGSKKQVAAEDFLTFWQRILQVSLVTPYLAFLAVVCELPKFYAAGMVLMALYALYYSFPSVTRINFDRKIFRVR